MALRAGYEHARGEAVICLDADLQHPPELIPTLIDKWRDGYDVVQATRASAPATPVLNQTPVPLLNILLHRALRLVTGGKTTQFRLLDRSVVGRMNQVGVSWLTDRRALSLAGLHRCRVCYQPAARYAGRSTYAVQARPQPVIGGSFSASLIYGSVLAGFGVFSLITLFGAEFFTSHLFAKATAFGWAMAQLTVLAAGAQLILTGIMAGYISRTLRTEWPRPAYIIGDTSDFTAVTAHGNEVGETESDLQKVRLMYRSLTPPAGLLMTVY